MSKKLFGIVGPSGSGKSTYVAYAREKTRFGEIVSTTTRLPRKGEIDGKDYHFVTQEEFKNIEMIEIDEYAGNFYGTAQKDLDYAYLQSDCAFMVVTYEGAQIFKKLFKEKNLDIDVITIFVHTPIEELEKRMINRGDDKKRIKERIENIKQRKEYDNLHKTDYVFETSSDLALEETCQQFTNFIYKISGES